MPPSLSFRTRILLIVLAGAVVPLALLGYWLTSTASRSGEELLRTRLGRALDETVAEIGSRWIAQRSELLGLAEEQSVQRLLGGAPPRGGADPAPPGLLAAFREAGPTLDRALIRDARGGARWTLSRRAADARSEAFANPPLVVPLEIYDRLSGRRLGTLEAGVQIPLLLGERTAGTIAAGAVLAIFDGASGTSLLPLPFDPAVMTGDRFAWAGDWWLVGRRTLAEPALELVAAAPLGPFTQPFERAARRGAWVVLAVGVASVALAALLTGRLTGSLERLAGAAEAVSRGDLERTVGERGSDEVGRLARSFNAMTASLRRTLRELAQREALAAVGEFAAGLAHEVRNPLTAIRVDLQMVEERLPEGSPARELQAQALQEIERLDRTVSGALLVARSGRITLRPMDIYEPLRAAMRAAEPEFRARGAVLELLSAAQAPVRVQGDAGALEQVFLNLLLNAAQAVGAGGRATVEVHMEAGSAVVSIRDSGPGIPAELRQRIFEPFFSTRPEGTGLGLAIAQRIVAAHRGEIRIECAPDAGTTVHVTIRSAP